MAESTIKLSTNAPAFIGDGQPGYSLHCKNCGHLLVDHVGDRQIIGLFIECPMCGRKMATQQRQGGEPIPTRVVLITGGDYNFSDSVDVIGKPNAIVSEDALNSYRAEVGYRSTATPRRTLDEALLESLARQGTELLGREQYDRHLGSIRRSKASAMPSKNHHRLVELVEYAHIAADGIKTARGVTITLDGDLLCASIAPGSLGHRVGRGEDACHGGEQREPARAGR